MYFYLQKTEHYIALFWRFSSIVFPQILGLYICVFKLLINKMFRRFWSQGFKGLKIALAESVAMLN
jgi:hypothetical protein